MKNVTISLPENLLLQTKAYARKHNTSVNALIKDLLISTVKPNNFPEEFLLLAERSKGTSKGQKWKREALYER